MDAVRNLGSIATGAYVEARLAENGQDYNRYSTSAAKMLDADEQQVAHEVFDAVGNGEEDLLSLYDRWHVARSKIVNAIQGPMLSPDKLKQGVAEQLGFADVSSMTAAAHEQHRLFEEMLRLQAEEDDDESGEAGKVVPIGIKRHRRKQDGIPNHERRAA